MKRLKKDQKEKVDGTLKKKDVLKIINEQLKEMDLADFEVTYLQVRPKSTEVECKPGFRKRKVYHNGQVYFECKPIV